MVYLILPPPQYDDNDDWFENPLEDDEIAKIFGEEDLQVEQYLLEQQSNKPKVK